MADLSFDTIDQYPANPQRDRPPTKILQLLGCRLRPPELGQPRLIDRQPIPRSEPEVEGIVGLELLADLLDDGWTTVGELAARPAADIDAGVPQPDRVSEGEAVAELLGLHALADVRQRREHALHGRADPPEADLVGHQVGG